MAIPQVHHSITGSNSSSMDEMKVILGEKRRFQDVGGKATGDGLSVCVKQVAEMVLVLAAMAKIRASTRPTPVEVEMMMDAREKLAEISGGYAPKDVFPTDAFATVIEDLGLKRVREKMSIAQKLQLTTQKMEKSEAFQLHSATYTPRVTEPCATPHAVQTVPPGKADHAPVSSRSLLNHSSVVHASPASNSRNLPYQLPTSEVRSLGSNVLTSSNLGRANSVGDHKAYSFSKAGLNNGSAHLTNINPNMQQHINFAQPPAANTHNEIGKIVQKVLQPHIPDHHTWNPPSRDYMNKALTCQTCKSMINEVDTVLVCDACEKGYHLRCLQCNPKSIFGDGCFEWHCANCLAISNGKPLPLKYGRVMRNINTPNRPASSAGVQPSLEKKVHSSDENFNQHLMSANASTQNGIKLESNPKGENREDEEVVERGNIAKTSDCCTTVRENEGPLPSSMHDVEWVGGVINEIDGKMYYGSCCISGTKYKLQDYALFSSTGNNLMPNKLQEMWEDNKKNKKWVTVTRCFIPDDLPEGVGRPCAPEGNEVYESNHEITIEAGLIHGPCEVLPPCKFSEERVIQTHSLTKAFDKPKRFFLCKWFYDKKKRVFRDVTC